MNNLTPKEIVNRLDEYIIGQEKAKKSVAVALRNRYRRSLLDKEFQEEIKPKNILMMGPTGVGKTEIARRLANLVNAPFIKVEATKFTEVGYVGRDVESMIRDLVETSIKLVKEEQVILVKDKAKDLAKEKVLDILVPRGIKKPNISNPFEAIFGTTSSEPVESNHEESLDFKAKRKKYKEQLEHGAIDERIIEITVEDHKGHNIGMIGSMGMEDMNINMEDIFSGILPKKTKKRKVTVKEALKIIAEQEAQKLIDMETVKSEGVRRAEQSGIIFIDEIDKIAGRNYSSGANVSREGVQRDILPVVEGSTVMTKYGMVKTDHMLFIAAGAFHVAKVTDLIPELQGRFPTRVVLEKLSQKDFEEILVKPKNALIKQYQKLLETDGVEVEFEQEALQEIARTAFLINEQGESIGARRLHTILEELLEEIAFEAPDIENKKVIIDRKYVEERFKEKIKRNDVGSYII